MNVFIDTNVLMDVLEQRQPFYLASARVWTLAETGKVKGFISVPSLANLFYLLRQRGTRASAREALALLIELFHLVPFDVQIAERAMDAEIPDFEDAVQFCSAIRCCADVVITRNAPDFPHREIRIQTPQQFLNAELSS